MRTLPLAAALPPRGFASASSDAFAATFEVHSVARGGQLMRTVGAGRVGIATSRVNEPAATFIGEATLRMTCALPDVPLGEDCIGRQRRAMGSLPR
jgi:hypothetical protein